MTKKLQLQEKIPVTEINVQSPSFDFLNDEPDLYSRRELKKLNQSTLNGHKKIPGEKHPLA